MTPTRRIHRPLTTSEPRRSRVDTTPDCVRANRNAHPALSQPSRVQPTIPKSATTVDFSSHSSSPVAGGRTRGCGRDERPNETSIRKLILDPSIDGAHTSFRRWIDTTSDLVEAGIRSGSISDTATNQRLAWNLCSGSSGQFTVSRSCARISTSPPAPRTCCRHTCSVPLTTLRPRTAHERASRPISPCGFRSLY